MSCAQLYRGGRARKVYVSVNVLRSRYTVAKGIDFICSSFLQLVQLDAVLAFLISLYISEFAHELTNFTLATQIFYAKVLYLLFIMRFEMLDVIQYVLYIFYVHPRFLFVSFKCKVTTFLCSESCGDN